MNYKVLYTSPLGNWKVLSFSGGIFEALGYSTEGFAVAKYSPADEESEESYALHAQVTDFQSGMIFLKEFGIISKDECFAVIAEEKKMREAYEKKKALEKKRIKELGFHDD